jgi:hypothetical protein
LNPLAKVLTAPPGVTSLTVLSEKLATKRSPWVPKAKPLGLLKPLAKVLTIPPGVTSLTVPPEKLATKKPPRAEGRVSCG